MGTHKSTIATARILLRMPSNIDRIKKKKEMEEKLLRSLLKQGKIQ